MLYAILKWIKYIHIPEIYAFLPVIGIENVLSDSEKLQNFLIVFSQWFDFFSGFTSKFNDIINDLGYGGFIIGDGDGGEDDGKFEPTRDQKMSITLLNHLYEKQLFTPTGKMGKKKL